MISKRPAHASASSSPAFSTAVCCGETAAGLAAGASPPVLRLNAKSNVTDPDGMIGTWFASSNFLTPSDSAKSAADTLIGAADDTETRLSDNIVTTMSLVIGRVTPCRDRSYLAAL